MAGHSKWSNIKHRKGKEDARRSKIFTKLGRMIEVAAKEGGGDVEMNFKLRLAIEHARAANMPNDNIERAIKRGIGELEGQNYEEFVYEGYGPGGVAVMLQIMTDNRNRAASEVRHAFTKYGGNLGESGCVAWMFESKAELRVGPGVDEEELMMVAASAGAEDIEDDEDGFVVIAPSDMLGEVRDSLTEADFEVEKAEITMLPKSTVEVDGEIAEKSIKLLEALEDLDDVQDVYSNLELTEDAYSAIEGM